MELCNACRLFSEKNSFPTEAFELFPSPAAQYQQQGTKQATRNKDGHRNVSQHTCSFYKETFQEEVQSLSPLLESGQGFALTWPTESSKNDFLSHFINMPYSSPCSLESLILGAQPSGCKQTQATTQRACIQVFWPTAAPAEVLANSRHLQADVIQTS